MVTLKGALGLGQFPEILLHKQEKERVLKAVGIKVEHGGPIEHAETRGAYETPRVLHTALGDTTRTSSTTHIDNALESEGPS